MISFDICKRRLFVPVTAAGGVPGGVDLHPQHQRYETAQDPAQHPHKPLRCVLCKTGEQWDKICSHKCRDRFVIAEFNDYFSLSIIITDRLDSFADTSLG